MAQLPGGDDGVCAAGPWGRAVHGRRDIIELTYRHVFGYISNAPTKFGRRFTRGGKRTDAMKKMIAGLGLLLLLAVAAPFAAAGDARQTPEKSARISFATPELLWSVLTAKRWGLLKVLCGAGPVSIREAARRVGRDVKAVHGDITALLNAGILVRSDEGGIVFPFDAVKVEFLLNAA